MDSVVINKKEILTEANTLVRNGLRNAAIELLLEYLESDPDSSTVLNALGRIYLLDHQPEQAVIYLKKSLAVKQSGHSDSITSDYQLDDFNDDDMAYIDSLVEKQDETIFSFEVDDSDSNKVIIEEKAKPDITTTFDAVTDKKDLIDKSVEIKDIIDAGTSKEGCDEESKDNNIDHYISPDIIVSEVDGDYPFIEQPDLDLDYDDRTESIYDEKPNQDEEFDDFDDALLNEDEEKILVPECILSEEDVPDELCWSDFEDLDEFNELVQRQFEDVDKGDDKLSREDRALQAAVEVIDRHDWDHVHLQLIQQIFIENGWGAARVAIEREMVKGLTSDQLRLARKIRHYWTGNEQYWMSFYNIYSNARFQQTAATYKYMSWVEAIRIINSFSCLPDIEDIYQFIEEKYYSWYRSSHLRRTFKAFLMYLKYQTGSIPRTLPGDCLYSFFDSEDMDFGIDSYNYVNTLSPEMQMLSELGVHVQKWPEIPENKMKLLKEEKA